MLINSSIESKTMSLTPTSLANNIYSSVLQGFAKIMFCGLAPKDNINLISDNEAQSKPHPCLTNSFRRCLLGFALTA